ncbi:MAG: helix-turn-helix transcriptional regulator [Actinomycetota bacterium]|nr:helix-turn-helix transcriptional regulator [Actinomycetota bacterium]
MSDLRGFLRTRRERLTPADVGLPDSGRRRTPGLRREEVAALAGVSIDYLTRLEQGRDTNPSAAVLGALADALRLEEDDKRYLRDLVKMQHLKENTAMCPGGQEPDRAVAPTVRTLLARLEPTPAFVVGPYGTVLAHNGPWERVVSPLGMLDGDEPNLARYVFRNEASRAAYADWGAAADEQVSHLRTASVRWHEDPQLAALLDELAAVPEFSERWTSHDVATKRRGHKTLRHPAVGDLRLAYEVLELSEEHQRLVTWLAADEQAERALAAAAGAGRAESPPRLRVVGED